MIARKKKKKEEKKNPDRLLLNITSSRDSYFRFYYRYRLLGCREGMMCAGFRGKKIKYNKHDDYYDIIKFFRVFGTEWVSEVKGAVN